MSNLKKYLKVYKEDAKHKKAFQQYMAVISENQDFFTRHEVNEFLTDMIKDGTLVYDEGIIGDMAKKIGVPFLVAALMFNSTFGKMKASDLGEGPPQSKTTISLVKGEYNIDNKEIKDILDTALKDGKINKVQYNTAMKNSQLKALKDIVLTVDNILTPTKNAFELFKAIKEDPNAPNNQKVFANKKLSSMNIDEYNKLLEKVEKDFNSILDSSKNNQNDKQLKETLKVINNFKQKLQNINSDIKKIKNENQNENIQAKAEEIINIINTIA